MAGEALARLVRSLALEDRDISATGEVFAVGAHEQRPDWKLFRLTRGGSQVFDPFLTERLRGGFASERMPTEPEVSSLTLFMTSPQMPWPQNHLFDIA